MMSLKAVRTTNDARPHEATKSKNTDIPSTPSPSPSATISTTQDEPPLRIFKIFPFIDDTYRDLQRFISGFHKDSMSSQFIQTVNKYKNGCSEIYGKALESYVMCYKLAENIVRTIDIFKELCTCLSDLEEYNYRLCEIMSIFITCELRLSVDASEQEHILIAHRIIYIMRRHLVQEEENETLHNILRTLVYIPKLFNARDIMCAIFSEFIPLKPMPEVNVLPDKLYMLYIIVFYRWMMMQKDDDDKLLIVNFAESFMKPSVSLCSNNLYGAYLPMYTTHSTATRTILNNLKFYRDIRNASIIDNALKKVGTIVNLCDDDEDDDIIILGPTSTTRDFAQIFSSVRLEPLSGSLSKIKLEVTTVVDTVDLTAEEEPANANTSVIDRHEKWLNEFQKLAQQYRESQLLLQKQQHNQLISTGEKHAVISLDSDSEGEEDISVGGSEETGAAAKATAPQNNCEDLFVDNYPLTNTPLNYDSDVESLDAEDENDVTKISPRFLSGTLRTYQAKKSNLYETEDKSNSDADEQNKLRDLDKSYRRDSIHISSTPPDETQNDDDDGTDVQDEHDDLLDEEEEMQAYAFLPTANKRAEKDTLPIRPMGPYPTYNNMDNDKVYYSHTTSLHPHQQQQHPNKDKQYYYSDSSETKTAKKQKKKVQFSTKPLGPNISKGAQTLPLKPALHQNKYKVSDAPENYRLRGFERFSCANSNDDASSTLGSNSTISSTKQQDHLEAASFFFRKSYPLQFSPSVSPLATRSLTSPSKPSADRRKSLLQNSRKLSEKLRRPTMDSREKHLSTSEYATGNMGRHSIIRNRRVLNDGYHSTGLPGISSFGESSDDCCGVASDSDIVINKRYNNDAKLRKRCAVVLTPTKEMIQYERKRDEMYNELLQKQRRNLELRALEKLREKERRRLGQWDEKKEKSEVMFNKTITSKSAKHNDISMSSESEYETNFELRTRKPRQQSFKELEPLNVQTVMFDSTSTLLSEIESHLDKPAPQKCSQLEELKKKDQSRSNHIIQQTRDVKSDKSQPKLEELNLLADTAEHVSPYQLDLPKNNSPPATEIPATEPLPPTSAAHRTPIHKEVEKEKITITEQLIIQPLDNLPEQRNSELSSEQQRNSSNIYAHEPKLHTTPAFPSSPCKNIMQNKQNNTQLESEDNNSIRKETNQKPEKNNEILEQILEESINVFKSVTSPYNTGNDVTNIQQEMPSDSTIPLLISNVESLNQCEKNNEDSEKNPDEVNTLIVNNKNIISENLSLSEKIKEVEEEHNSINAPLETVFSTNMLRNVESSIMCASDLANITNESVISQSLKIHPLMAADLSDISLESEMSKHLPEIAEPSPVVTDMSENSNESDVSKKFGLHIPINSSSIRTGDCNNEISVPDLSVLMPNISQSIPLTTGQSVESSFTELNSSLNTPVKLAIDMSKQEELAGNTTNELNTPLKFDVQPAVETENMPLKITLEPDADNNVTKYLDLILNKTVTDAESEARDKIIKELNALTTDTTLYSYTSENRHNEKITLASKLNDQELNKSIAPESIFEEDKNLEKKSLIENANDANQENNLITVDYTETDSSAKEISKQKSGLKCQNISWTPNTKNLLNSPKVNIKGDHTEPLRSTPSTIFAAPLSSGSSSQKTEIKLPSIKQTFNIKCRVRLKRLNKDDLCRMTKNQFSIDMPITNPTEPLSSNNDITKCDNVIVKLLPVKKPCLKHNNKYTNRENEEKITENSTDALTASDVIMPTKKPKLEVEKSIPDCAVQTSTSLQLPIQTITHTPETSTAAMPITLPTTKPKTKSLKTVTFDLSNLNEQLRDSIGVSHKQKLKPIIVDSAVPMGSYLKSSRPSKKLPDNTLRAAETLQLFVNSINDSVRTPPAAEFNKKRSPIKNKCIAEDATPRPPPASTLMGTPPCKKSCTEKSRSQMITPKCKDQLVSSLTTPSISNITTDITTTRIYTSSPLDQTLPEYDDNVDTVADSELILPTTTGSLRRKLKRPKKSLSRPEPTDDISTDDVSNQPECNAEDDTDAVVDNEDDVFAQELLPITAANEHILEEIVNAPPSLVGASTVIRDDYMNIEATPTVPVYLFNDESRDLGSPELIQSSDNTSVVDSSSYLKTSSTPSNVVAAAPPNTASALGNLEKSMLSPSEHEVSSTQETFYQTPTKNKQSEIFGEKSSTSKEKVVGTSVFTASSILKQKPEDNGFQNKEEYRTSSNIGLLQNNQVDTTNHSPEACNLALTSSTANTTTLSSNRKIRKASTHDEILLHELQQQQQQQSTSNKRKSNTFCVESTSDNKNNAISKNKVVQKNLEDIKSNGSLAKVDDKFKKLLKEVCKRDKSPASNNLEVSLPSVSNICGGGGSSPSTTTNIFEDKLLRSKRKKQKSSKSNKTKTHTNERSTKIVLKASKLTPHIPANPLIITIPKSRLLKPIDQKDAQNEFSDILNSKLFIEKNKETAKPTIVAQEKNQDNHNSQFDSMTKKQLISAPTIVISNIKKSSQSPVEINTQFSNITQDVIPNTNSATVTKEKSSTSILTMKKKEKVKASDVNNSNDLIFVKDKYDLIKSKDKHQHHFNHHSQQDNKDKAKDRTNSQSKSGNSMNARLHKNSSKEKTKGEKVKEKFKDIEKIITNHKRDNVLKLNIIHANNKSFSSSLSKATTSSPGPSFSINNAKQNNSKSKSFSDLCSNKPKMNFSPAQSAAAIPTTQITAVPPSTNNVRKKLKIK